MDPPDYSRAVRILDKYFHGEQDVRTLDLLEKLKEKMTKGKT